MVDRMAKLALSASGLLVMLLSRCAFDCIRVMCKPQVIAHVRAPYSGAVRSTSLRKCCEIHVVVVQWFRCC